MRISKYRKAFLKNSLPEAKQEGKFCPKLRKIGVTASNPGHQQSPVIHCAPVRRVARGSRHATARR